MSVNLFTQSTFNVVVGNLTIPAPISKTQQGTHGLNGEPVAHVREDKSTTTEETFHVDSRSLNKSELKHEMKDKILPGIER